MKKSSKHKGDVESVNISFECQACEADFEIEIPKLVESPESLKCPNCDAHPPAHRSHAFATALEDLLAAIAGVRRKVRFELALNSQELPPPYGALEEGESGLDFEDEDERDDEDLDDEDEDEDEDDDDLSYDDLEDDDLDDDDDDDEDFDDDDDDDFDDDDEDLEDEDDD